MVHDGRIRRRLGKTTVGKEGCTRLWGTSSNDAIEGFRKTGGRNESRTKQAR